MALSDPSYWVHSALRLNYNWIAIGGVFRHAVPTHNFPRPSPLSFSKVRTTPATTDSNAKPF